MSKKILLLDDSDEIRDLVCHLLQFKNFIVKAVRSRIEMMETVFAFLPNLILLDVLLRGDDGRDICKYLKANPVLKHIPVILFSASTYLLKNYAEYGAIDIVEKPFDTNELVRKINQCMNNGI